MTELVIADAEPFLSFPRSPWECSLGALRLLWSHACIALRHDDAERRGRQVKKTGRLSAEPLLFARYTSGE